MSQSIDPQTFPFPSSFETQRLLARTATEADAPALHEALAESAHELREFLGHLPWVKAEPTLEAALTRCRAAQAFFLQRTDLVWFAFEKGSGKLVGSVGLHRSEWSVPKTEVGYWLRTSATGKGYASELVNAATDWALHTLGAQRVSLVTDEANQASIAVANRCGFELEAISKNAARAPDGSLRNLCTYARLFKAAECQAATAA
jgi:RimJ/RimL family protein N-acetyltransferase